MLQNFVTSIKLVLARLDLPNGPLADFKNGDFAYPEHLFTRINRQFIGFNYFFEIIIPIRGDKQTSIFKQSAVLPFIPKKKVEVKSTTTSELFHIFPSIRGTLHHITELLLLVH